MKKRRICLVVLILVTWACILPQMKDAPVQSAAPSATQALLTQTPRVNPVLTSTAALTSTVFTPTIVFTPTPVENLAPTTQTLGIGSTQISLEDGMTLMYVPAGEFKMGSTGVQYQAGVSLCMKAGSSQTDCQKWIGDEQPLHTVYLDAFWIDQTVITNKMYVLCVSAGNCQTPDKTNSNTRNSYYGDSQYSNFPVIDMDWNQAKAYCKWAGRRLPTEAEWEKAARGTDGRTYPWGEGIDDNKANYNQNIKDTSKVGSYPAGASPYGALDMAGNVWEWVADWYGGYPNSSQNNPQGPSSGNYRVLRGGSWANYFGDPHSALRYGFYPSDQYINVGFRCAMSATVPTN